MGNYYVTTEQETILECLQVQYFISLFTPGHETQKVKHKINNSKPYDHEDYVHF